MREEAKKDLKPLEIDVPRGVTVPPGRAAEILGVSVSSLKKRASEWGLHTFWEANGDRYSLIELEAAKLGVLEAVEPVMIILDFDSIAEYFIPDGYGFIVYGGGGIRPITMDRYFAPDLCDVKQWIQERLGIY